MSKWRTWRLEDDNCGGALIAQGDHTADREVIQVIEIGAIEEQENELRKLRDELTWARAENSNLIEERDQLHAEQVADLALIEGQAKSIDQLHAEQVADLALIEGQAKSIDHLHAEVERLTTQFQVMCVEEAKLRAENERLKDIETHRDRYSVLLHDAEQEILRLSAALERLKERWDKVGARKTTSYAIVEAALTKESK